jgi:hypothetical protein
MSNKKLLSEAQVRRFMGLAGIRPLNEMTSGALDEVDLEEKRRKTEEMHGDDKKQMKEMGNYKEDDMNEMAAYKEDDEMEGDVDVEMEESLVDEFKDAVETIKKVEAALSGGAMEDEEDEEEDDMDMDMDKEEDDMEMDDKEEEGDEDMADLEEELMEVDMELTEDEIVSEVARRVAKRIVEAKRAHKKMNEALGRNRTVRRRK